MNAFDTSHGSSSSALRRPPPPAFGPAGTTRVTSHLETLKARSPKPGEASFYYHDHHFKHDAVKVLPGEYYVTTDDMVIMTVLGSCIAACIWDPKARVGA